MFCHLLGHESSDWHPTALGPIDRRQSQTQEPDMELEAETQQAAVFLGSGDSAAQTGIQPTIVDVFSMLMCLIWRLKNMHARLIYD